MKTLGVVIGRFQVDELTPGHKSLILEAKKQAGSLLILIGEGPLPTTKRNPLSYLQRLNMIIDFMYNEQIDDYCVRKLEDMPSDAKWSLQVDDLIQKTLDGDGLPVLYCSRDSVQDYYTGLYPIVELDTTPSESGTERRKKIGDNNETGSPEFRRGVIWANHKRFPTVYSCVDAVVIKRTSDLFNPYLLVIQKDPSIRDTNDNRGSENFMFPGGFAEPDSPSDEVDAMREVYEETTVVASDPIYIGSFQIDDWRYKGETDCIRTRLFELEYSSGTPKGQDDAYTAKWMKLDQLVVSDFDPCHQPLFTAYCTYLTEG